MRQATHHFFVETIDPGLTEVTQSIEGWLQEQAISEGLLTVFVAHTSASLVVQENADPDVQRDLQDFFARLAPETEAYRHASEGPDDMPAHIKAALTATQVSIPVTNGRAMLGTWQGIYLFEHRARPHRRRIIVHLIGE